MLLLSVNKPTNAQPGSTTNSFDDEPQDVPLDGGIVILASVCITYGYYKFKNKDVNF
ncbi:MAG: hypothetical protein ACOYMA_02085 [Bacteroidia bacterium]